MMDYDINEKETSLDNMGDSLLEAMKQCIDDSRPTDAKSILNEWIVDGRDPMVANMNSSLFQIAR